MIKKKFNEYNIQEAGLNSLIKKAYEYLNLITFYTAGPKECRAWSILRDSRAPNAAEKMLSDFEKVYKSRGSQILGFYNVGNEDEAKKQGLIKSEGKDYMVQDGDIIQLGIMFETVANIFGQQTITGGHKL